MLVVFMNVLFTCADFKQWLFWCISCLLKSLLYRNFNYGKIVCQKTNRKKQQGFSMLSKEKVKEYWTSHCHQSPQAALLMLMISILYLTLKNTSLSLQKLLIYCTKLGT